MLAASGLSPSNKMEQQLFIAMSVPFFASQGHARKSSFGLTKVRRIRHNGRPWEIKDEIVWQIVGGVHGPQFGADFRSVYDGRLS